MFKNPAMNSVMKKLTAAVKAANVSALSSTDNTEININLTVSDIDCISAIFEQFDEAMELAYSK